VKKGELFDTIW